ncbi:reverse transcriptase domain-containing protein [Tanacetum coccineum]
MHSGPRSVVAKVIRTGYYWPTMHTYARKLIRECNDCQVHSPIPRNPQQNLTPITSPWPFYKWGIDIAGPFPEGPGKVKFLIVAIDYFTKWIEAKPVATITGNQVKKFVWDKIVCRFGLPGEIVSDNGKQFRDNPFKDWLTISLQDGVTRELVTMFPTSKIKKNDKNEVQYSLRISLTIYLNTPALFLQLVDERNAEDDIELHVLRMLHILALLVMSKFIRICISFVILEVLLSEYFGFDMNYAPNFFSSLPNRHPLE